MLENEPHPVEVRFFDPHAASAAQWAAYHRYRRLRTEEDLPGEPVVSDVDFEHVLRKRWPVHEGRRFVALQGGEVVANLFIESRREGSPDYERFAPFINAGGGVLQPWRRRGIATTLLRTLLGFMQAHAKHTATLSVHLPEAHAFLAAVGASEKHRYFENRLPLNGLNWDELARWKGRATRTPGLRWEIHAGRVPMERLAQLMAPFTVLINDIPLGALDLPPMRYELQAHTSWYEELDRIDGEHLVVLLIDSHDQVAAVCNAHWEARFPDRVYQALTAVGRPWRGKGLAKAVKAAMLELVRERHPDVQMIVTANAEVNAPMLSINQRLGFLVHRRNGSYQIDPHTLQVFLSRGA
ncbi:GNAT family N-acetyltransferase [Variovorax sp. RT4R15]|uniref:GNAT family N-acetyltransferase n=1 Tax=Variovorax sp. RT4R15 TaxID=3443737 RepID=UPI003F45B9F9